MKKKLSLAVAGLMALTLAPVNTFALKADYSSVASVENNDGSATFRAEFEIQSVDVVRPGAVTIQLLGDDVAFKDDKIKIKAGGHDYTEASPEVEIKDNYAIFTAPQLNATDKLEIQAEAKFDGAKDGEYEVAYDLTGIGLSKYVKKYAKVTTSEGTFVKATESKKTVGRGKATGAKFEIKNTDSTKVVLSLPSDYEWDTAETKVFPNQAVAHVDADHKNKVKFDIPANSKLFVTPVFSVPKGASKGDIEVNVQIGKEPAGKFVEDKSESVVVAEYVDYAVSMELKKAVQEVLANGDTYKAEVIVKSSDKTDLPKYVDFEVDGAKVVVKSDNLNGNDSISPKGDKDKPIDEFTATTTAKKELRFTLEITPDWDKDGDVTLKAKGRGMEELSLVILKVQPVAKMTVVEKEVLGGDAKVAVNDIVIKETKGAALKPGTRYGVTLQGLKFEDAKFDAKGKIEAEGIKVKDLTVDKKDTTIYFTVDGRSKKDAPATITLKDVQVVSNRSLPFGTHKLTFAKVADEKATQLKRGAMYMYEKKDEYELFEINKADFIKVVDKVSKVKKTTIFTLGSADYTVEGVDMKLDTPVFTQDNYTMLPVRAIAEALGVEVVWNQENSTATFIDGDIVVSVTTNAKVLYKNGNQYPMTTKATVKAKRMFIPVSSVGDAFGLTRDIDYTYNTATKQVTIYPKKEAVKMEEKKVEEKKAEEVKPAETK